MRRAHSHHLVHPCDMKTLGTLTADRLVPLSPTLLGNPLGNCDIPPFPLFGTSVDGQAMLRLYGPDP